MSDCCTHSDGFPNASIMQGMATNNSVVWTEICMIQQAILAASSQCQIGGGKMCTVVGGTTPMTFLTGIESVLVTSPGGPGYIVDTPTIKIKRPLNAIGDEATASISTNGGSILTVTVIDGGSGYQPVLSTIDILSATGTSAAVLPLVDASGNLVSVNIVNPGSGYIGTDLVIATRAVSPDPLYTDATFQIMAVGASGEILSIKVLNPGSGYQDSVAIATIVSSIDETIEYPVGGGFESTVYTDPDGVISRVNISNIGAGYMDLLPYLVISDIGTGAVTKVFAQAGTISTISVINPGVNYTQGITGVVMNPITALLPNPPANQASVTFKVSNNTFGTTPQTYYQTWAGLATNKQIQVQINTVLTYFKKLGYTISIKTNPAGTGTIVWQICW